MNREERRELRDRLQARFQQLAVDEKWKQETLAEEAGLPLRTVSDFLRSVSVPNEKTLRAMATALSVSLTAEEERAKWPNDLNEHLDLIGLVLAKNTPSERRKKMEAIVRVLMS